ncbi:MAG: Ig-like domain-containing protein, partial [Spirochaetia bacterium]|nr:Ig-like domain-containing protein [Spirochaetia bacterium]
MFRKSLIINKTVILAFLLVSAVFLANCGGNTSSSSSGGSSGGGGGTKATTTTAVVPSTPSLEPLDDTGISNDSITSMNTGMHFIGTATAGDSVEILIDGSSTIPATTGTTNGTGYWSIQYTGAALTNGSHSITAKATSGTAVSAESSAFTLDIDNSPSTITNGTVASNNTVTVTFNEEVFTNILGGAIVASDFAITNFAANGGNATAISIASMTHTPGTTTATFTLNITGTPSGVETFKISNSNAVYDLAANSMAANSQFTPTLTLKDKLAPTLNPVTIASNNAAPAWATVGDTVTISFTSSEAIGTPLVDIGGAGTASSTVTNVSGNNWTASRMMVSGDTEGVVSFTINFNDLAGNAGNQVIAKTSGSSVIFDKTKPTVAIGAPSLSRVNSTGSVTYGITYTGGTTFNLTPGTVTLNTTGGATCSIGVTNGATSTPTVTLSSCTGDGTVGISLASASSDAAGNTDIGAGPSATFSVDNTAPTVAITYNQSGNTGPTFVAGPVTITATYSESVASAPNISISQQGSAAISNVAMSGSGAVYTYTYTVNTATGGTYIDGTATVTLSAINDLAGNTAAAPTNNTFVTSTIQPSVAITYNQGGNTG